MKESEKSANIQYDVINYVSSLSILRDLGAYPHHTDPIDFLKSEASHGLEQVKAPPVMADLDSEEEYGMTANQLLDSVYSSNLETIKLVLSEMANVIARLTHTFPDEKSMRIYKARLIENLIEDARSFIELYPEIQPSFGEDEMGEILDIQHEYNQC